MAQILESRAYCGKIIYGDKHFHFGAALPEDAFAIAKLYSSIAIAKHNYLEKLTPGPMDFSCTGGMFAIHSEQSILTEMDSGKSLFAMVRDECGEPASLLWVSTEDPGFDLFLKSRTQLPGAEHACRQLHKAAVRGTLIFTREIIVAPQSPPCMAKLLLYTVFSTMNSLGYTHTPIEVYKALSYREGDREHEVMMRNDRSFHLALRTGAQFLGLNSLREITLQEVPVTVLIEPQMLCFDFVQTLPKLKDSLKGLGAYIVFDNDTICFNGGTSWSPAGMEHPSEGAYSVRF